MSAMDVRRSMAMPHGRSLPLQVLVCRSYSPACESESGAGRGARLHYPPRSPHPSAIHGRHSRTAPPPSWSLSAPAGGLSLTCGRLPRFCPQRAAGRGQPGRRQRQAAPSRRRAPAPCTGFEPVEKVSTHSIPMGMSGPGRCLTLRSQLMVDSGRDRLCCARRCGAWQEAGIGAGGDQSSSRGIGPLRRCRPVRP